MPITTLAACCCLYDAHVHCRWDTINLWFFSFALGFKTMTYRVFQYVGKSYRLVVEGKNLNTFCSTTFSWTQFLFSLLLQNREKCSHSVECPDLDVETTFLVRFSETSVRWKGETLFFILYLEWAIYFHILPRFITFYSCILSRSYAYLVLHFCSRSTWWQEIENIIFQKKNQKFRKLATFHTIFVFLARQSFVKKLCESD